MLNWLKKLWENYKPVMVTTIITAVKGCNVELAKKMGMSKEEADRILAVICDYIKRQL